MIASAKTSATKKPIQKAALGLWMERVLEELDHASKNLDADPVHDLRVALRRCRSIADGLKAFDPDPAWKQMKKEARRVFRALGELRDNQVMQGWVRRLGHENDLVTRNLLQFLSGQETHVKQQAALALGAFDRKQWKKWSEELPKRARSVRPGSLIFRHLALERWTEAYELHHRALRNRSQIASHALRIGLKRFRYIVENFLPLQHSAWSNDLKHLQDLLGEVHDLDVLWATAMKIMAFPDDESKQRWRTRILEERSSRIDGYRGKMLGKSALWHIWRAELPQGRQIQAGALLRFKRWAAFLAPNVRHSNHVARLALQLYDGLAAESSRPLRRGGSNGFKKRNSNRNGTNDLKCTYALDERSLLQAAALLQDVGRSEGAKAHHKKAFRLISQMDATLGWPPPSLHLIASVARYHRGALPRAGQRALTGMDSQQRKIVMKLGGILRLANAFDSDEDGRIEHLHVVRKNGALAIAAEGYSPRLRMAERVAAARYLLELVYKRPVIVQPLVTRSAHRVPSK